MHFEKPMVGIDPDWLQGRIEEAIEADGAGPDDMARITLKELFDWRRRRAGTAP
jgi:hypothetical protein